MSLKALLGRAGRLASIGRAVLAVRRAGDAEKRLWARKYAVELMGGSRGLAAKVGQMMAQGEDAEDLRRSLAAASPRMPLEQVVEILAGACGASPDAIFARLEEEGIAASLGQVHFGELTDGRPVAVKVQYPEIREAVRAELRLFGWLPEMGPVSRFGISLDGYRQAFAGNCERELDYLGEARRQMRYRELARPVDGLIVPEVHPEICRPQVLVQRREEGFGLEKAVGLAPGPRLEIGRVLLDHFLHMLFRHGFLHADPHPGNLAFRQSGRMKYSVILYDYGCILEVERVRRLALLRCILALRDREPVDSAACLAALGFDVEKMRDLGPALPVLLGILFEPFVQEQPYDVRRWRMSERMDRVAGELKWWFRSAAPPELIFLVRALYGLIQTLAKLDARLPWGQALDERVGDLFPEARALSLGGGAGAGTFSGVARFLKVEVEKASGVRVKLAMPARLAEDIEAAMDETVLRTVRRQAIDLGAIQESARASGFAPQTLFSVKDEERSVRVWLE